MPTFGYEEAGMRIVPLSEIQSVMDMPRAISAVRQGFVDVANGLVEQPEPMQMLFHEDAGELIGDLHVKGAQAKARPFFALKLASGFYRNPKRNLPVNNGLVLVLSSETGYPIALLRDEGWLTQMRTAAAGALAAALKPVGGNAVLGVAGTGTQARLQALAIREKTGISRLIFYGRNPEKTAAYMDDMKAQGFDVVPAQDIKTICRTADILVTTTPSTEPIIRKEDLSSTLHIVAVGADSPGKVELEPDIFADAEIIATDSHTQCLAHGDFGAAVRAGKVSDTADISLCDILASKSPETDFSSVQLSVVDLTGLGAQDLAIASAVASAINLG